MSEPIDHHYLPQFFLSRWCGSDGKVCRFTRPTGGKAKANRVFPKGTAFEPRLYENKGLPAGRRQSMETDFFATVDQRGSVALKLLEEGRYEKRDWRPKARSDWSRFLVAQLMRSPEDIDQIRVSIRNERGKHGPAFHFRRPPGFTVNTPPSAEEVERENEAENERFVFSILRGMIDNKVVGQLFNDLHWQVLDIPQHSSPLVTSDRPIWMTMSLAEPDAFFVMPIGPRKLFTAVTRRETQGKLRMQSRISLVKKVNKFIVQHASAYVYADDALLLPFADKHMGAKAPPSLMARLAEARGHEIVPRRKARPTR